MGTGTVSSKMFGAVLFCGVVWFFYVGILINLETTKLTRTTVPETGVSDDWSRFIGRGRHPFLQNFHLNYVNKRRVPNGPDPIHNRRVSKSGKPPGRI
ncbi:hypothetical protein K2173_020360 [Erythroxylum novogranatense]|uniref:CLAVATA3/ESR (CLE)-related protein 25 n=1 Tax=Erythroxylum novogranatense TaxID=1862640 RepID=A0AAV8U7T0_9ROSI|nr:hypothetical protein K2173_020360 [Erythroxylum novogranatense]